MGEGVADLAEVAPVGGEGGARLRRALAPRCRRAGRACRRAGPRPGGSRPARLPSSRSASQAVPCRTGFAAFSARRGSSAATPARRAAQARARGRCRRRARAACRRWRRDPSPPGRSRRGAPPASAPSASARSRGFAAGSGASTRGEPRHHPLDVAVDDDRAPVEGDRRDRRRGVGADAGERAQARLGRRGSGRRARAPPPARRRGGCAPGRSSRGRPRRPSPRRPAAAARAATVGQRARKASK